MRVAPEWADDPIESGKFNRNAVEIPRYASIEADFSNEARRMVGDFLSGRTKEPTLINAFGGRLMDAETDAFVAGRRARGDTRTTISENEANMLAGRHASNMRYFHGFVQDMKNGAGRMPYMQRADAYAKSLWSIYTRGETTDWEDPSNDNARYFYVLDPHKDHCSSCIFRAKLARDQNGLTWDEVAQYGFPGEKCKCGSNCHCHIRVVKKALVLPERFDNLAAAASAKQGLDQLADLLGGEQFPLKIPAAGVPYVSLAPSTVNESLRAAGKERDELARRLPLIPQVLTSPTEVVHGSGGARHYVGSGMTVSIAPNENGIWKILALLAGDNWRKAA